MAKTCYAKRMQSVDPPMQKRDALHDRGETVFWLYGSEQDLYALLSGQIPLEVHEQVAGHLRALEAWKEGRV